MSVIDQALKANKNYASAFRKGALPMPPARKLAVVVCMDARIDPAKALGLEEGDAHVIRNAGGRIPDAIRSLVISQALLGTEEVAVIHHTDCGMLTFSDDGLRQKLRDERGVIADDIAFLPFNDVARSVEEDLEYYRRSPLVRHDIPIRGFIYDVRTGLVTEVVAVAV